MISRSSSCIAAHALGSGERMSPYDSSALDRQPPPHSREYRHVLHAGRSAIVVWRNARWRSPYHTAGSPSRTTLPSTAGGWISSDAQNTAVPSGLIVMLVSAYLHG